jgi:hypothetical protein
MGSAGRNVSDFNNLGVCTCFILWVQVFCKYMKVFKKIQLQVIRCKLQLQFKCCVR